MILADSSIWIDHLRRGDAELAGLLQRGQILGHPFVLGELALGSIKNRKQILGDLARLPQAVTARDDEVLAFIDANGLAGLGVGYVDAHLLASVRLTGRATLWTRDRRLQQVAGQLGLSP